MISFFSILIQYQNLKAYLYTKIGGNSVPYSNHIFVIIFFCVSITCFYSMFLFGLKYIFLKLKIFQKITSNNEKLEKSIYHRTWFSQIIIQIELCYSSAQCLSKSYPALSPSINPDFPGCFYRDGVKAALVSGAMTLHSVVAWEVGLVARCWFSR